MSREIKGLNRDGNVINLYEKPADIAELVKTAVEQWGDDSEIVLILNDKKDKILHVCTNLLDNERIYKAISLLELAKLLVCKNS